MDYIDIPRSLIYKDRTDLKDFGVQVIETVNHNLFFNLKMLFKATDRAKEIILRCFNNAYYICTLIPFEDFPEMQVAEYEKLLLKGNTYDREEICAVSMAMVSKLLPACDARWRSEDNDLINNIHYRFTHYQWMNSGARKSFEFMEEKHNTIGLYLPPNVFAPRDILEAIENVSVNDLAIGVIYICERLALLNDSRKRTYGADLAIARLNEDLHEIYEDWGYDPQKNKFVSEMEDPFIHDHQNDEFFWSAVKLKKEAIDYIVNHYPSHKNDTDKQIILSEESQSPNEEVTNATVAQIVDTASLQKLIEDLKRLNAELEKENKELREQLVNLSPQSSVSYEELKSRTETLQSLYDAAENRLKRYESILGTEEELNKEKKFNIAERIIFCSALLGCSLSEDDIIQQQMAKMISRFSGDRWQSIRTTISDMNGKRAALEEVAMKVKQEKDVGARMAIWRREEKIFQGLTNAALNVYKYLHSAVKGGTVGAKAHQCKQAMENIDHAYYLTERKLITPTDWQPQGDEFALPPGEI